MRFSSKNVFFLKSTKKQFTTQVNDSTATETLLNAILKLYVSYRIEETKKFDVDAVNFEKILYHSEF